MEIYGIEVSLFRLYKYLAHLKSFPTPLRAASVVSGIDETNIGMLLNRTSDVAGYVVIVNSIYNIREVNNMGLKLDRDEIMNLGKVTIHKATQKYLSDHIALVCHDGQPVQMDVEYIPIEDKLSAKGA